MKKFFIFILIFMSCQMESGTPEAQIRDFIEARISHVVTREFFSSKTTGKLKEIVENMSDEEFQQFSDLRNYQKESFKIHSKNCQQKKCFITYSLGYRSRIGNETKYTAEIKKIAELEFFDGIWLISDVSNVKSYIDSSDTIDALKD